MGLFGSLQQLRTQKHLTNPDSIWDHKATPQWYISGSFFGRTVFVMTQRNLYPLQRPPCSLGSGIEAPRQAHQLNHVRYLALKFRFPCSSLPKFQETPSQWLTSQSFQSTWLPLNSHFSSSATAASCSSSRATATSLLACSSATRSKSCQTPSSEIAWKPGSFRAVNRQFQTKSNKSNHQVRSERIPIAHK